jgi:hypothetical protein
MPGGDAVSASPEKQLAGFFAKYTPTIAARAKAIRAAMQTRLPGAIELVYDNYNALVIGFGSTDRASDIVFSIALYPRWVTLFFANGVGLPDPQRLLKGSGKHIRHIVLDDVADLDKPAIQELMDRALDRAGTTLDEGKGRLVIKSISPKQRPRRPAK